MKTTSPKLKPFLLLLVGALVLAVIGASILQFIGDGTKNYSGAKLEAAKIMLDHYDPLDDGPGAIPGFSNVSVSDVKYTPRESFPACKDANSEYSYTVTLKMVWWFGITTPLKSDSICRQFGG
jgi:hypothetical protein